MASLHFGAADSNPQRHFGDTWWMDRLWSQPPDTNPPTMASTQPLFYVLSLNSHFSGADLRKGALWPSAPQPLLHTALPLSPEGPGSQRATCRCHPLELQQQEHLPFLHAVLEAFTSCEAILSPRGGQAGGLKMLNRACPFFSWKIIHPTGWKRLCSQHSQRCSVISERKPSNSFQLSIMRNGGDYWAIGRPTYR